MVGVREDVAAGRIGRRLVEACRVAARSVTRSRPSPTGGRSWLEEDIDDLVQDTIARAAPEKVILAANEAANDTEFSGWLRRALRTTLDQRARGTPLGRVIRAIDDALREEPDRFSLEGKCWYLTSDGPQPGRRAETRELVAVAWTVETATVRLSRSAAKTPPMAARHDILADQLPAGGQGVTECLLELVGHRAELRHSNQEDGPEHDD